MMPITMRMRARSFCVVRHERRAGQHLVEIRRDRAGFEDTESVMVHHRHLAEGMTSQMFRLARLTLEHTHGHLVVLRALLGEQHTHGSHISAAIDAIERDSHFASPGRS
jgi:hypothetical protein